MKESIIVIVLILIVTGIGLHFMIRQDYHDYKNAREQELQRMGLCDSCGGRGPMYDRCPCDPIIPFYYL